MKKVKFRAKEYGKKGVWRYASGLSELAGFFCGLEDGQLDSKTLGEYIGLKDKNNKEIYGGDIAKYKFDKVLYVITWSDLNHWWYGEQIRKKNDAYTGGINGQELRYFKVVGNVYENPELLKTK